MNYDLTEKVEYYCDTAQLKYNERRKKCGTKIKLTQCTDAIMYIENKILKEKWSPDTAIGRYKIENHGEPCVSTKTIYNYIDLGLINVKSIDLLLKVKIKRKKNVIRKNKRILGQSIEERLPIVNSREEIGHWEIDTVMGQRNRAGVLMTLTERKSRMEIIKKLPDKTSKSVQLALAETKETYGGRFCSIFKSITCDNGAEFNFDEDFKTQIGVELFFSHPYSSFERGTNENHNGIIRRFIPKGKTIDPIPDDTIKRICDWMNNLPRKILDYKTPNEEF